MQCSVFYPLRSFFSFPEKFRTKVYKLNNKTNRLVCCLIWKEKKLVFGAGCILFQTSERLICLTTKGDREPDLFNEQKAGEFGKIIVEVKWHYRKPIFV